MPLLVLTKNFTLCTSSSPQNSRPPPPASSFFGGAGEGAVFLGGTGGGSGASSFSPFSALQAGHRQSKEMPGKSIYPFIWSLVAMHREPPPHAWPRSRWCWGQSDETISGPALMGLQSSRVQTGDQTMAALSGQGWDGGNLGVVGAQRRHLFNLECGVSRRRRHIIWRRRQGRMGRRKTEMKPGGRCSGRGPGPHKVLGLRQGSLFSTLLRRGPPLGRGWVVLRTQRGKDSCWFWFLWSGPDLRRLPVQAGGSERNWVP